MNAHQQKTTPPFTINAIHVGSKLYEVLVAHAKSSPGVAIRYGDLLAACRAANPVDEVVKRAVPIGIGMKLLFVQSFCEEHDYPNLACLAVNQTGKPGEGYPGDWELDMRKVANFDWSVAPAKLAIYVAEATARATSRRKVSEHDARDALFADYKKDKARYKHFDNDDREEMVNLLMEGMDLLQAYLEVTSAKAEQRQN